MQMEEKRKIWRFLGHVLRMPRDHHCATELTWTYGQKESRPPQNSLVPYCGEREHNGGLEVLGGSESSS